MSKVTTRHVCYDGSYPEEYVECYCPVGRDHSDDECMDGVATGSEPHDSEETR